MIDTSSSNRWALSSGGGNICSFTSLLNATVKDEQKVCQEAVEQGSFADYNKVDTPLEIKATLGLMGSDGELQSALNALSKYAHSTDLVSFVTPSAEYQNLNLRKFDYRLARRDGLGALYVTLDLVEIRQVKAEYSNVRVAPLQSRGLVQSKAAGSGAGGSGQPSQSAQKSARRSLLSKIKG